MVKVLNNPAETKAWWLVAVHVCANCATAYKLESGDAFEIVPKSAMTGGTRWQRVARIVAGGS